MLTAESTGDGQYREDSHAAFSYKRALYDQRARNWRDFRPDAESTAEATKDASCMHAWCHGAPGVSLARLGMLEELEDNYLNMEIMVALDSIADQGLDSGHSLCHGVIGNLEPFVVAAEALERTDLLDRPRQVAGQILASQPSTAGSVRARRRRNT